MKYVSTRGEAPPVHFVEAVLGGVAPDGGLYVPERLPQLSAPRGGPPSVTGLLEPFLAPEFEGATVRNFVRGTLDFSLPLRHLSGSIHLLELFHGPSAAFKDVGARFLARVLSRVAGSGAGSGVRTILVATSGDTGGAVAAAFHGVPGTRVVVLFPEGGVTPLQRRQFTTLGANVTAVAVPGPFDRCQALVREALEDTEVQRRHGLTSANSINLGRLLPQMLYYVHAASQMDREGGAPTFVIPSGNLGNLTAGVMAGRSAIPGARFVGAVNRNRALVRWLDGDGVQTTADTVTTPSTAMDVGRPSNLERLVHLAAGGPEGVRGEVTAQGVDDDLTLETIRRVRDRHGCLICPHTAVGIAAAQRLVEDGHTGPLVVLATAHPAKFPEVVRRATGATPELPPRLALLEARPEQIVGWPPGADAVAPLLDDLFA